MRTHTDTHTRMQSQRSKAWFFSVATTKASSQSTGSLPLSAAAHWLKCSCCASPINVNKRATTSSFFGPMLKEKGRQHTHTVQGLCVTSVAHFNHPPYKCLGNGTNLNNDSSCVMQRSASNFMSLQTITQEACKQRDID